jgi:hypothetical protein
VVAAAEDLKVLRALVSTPTASGDVLADGDCAAAAVLVFPLPPLPAVGSLSEGEGSFVEDEVEAPPPPLFGDGVCAAPGLAEVAGCGDGVAALGVVWATGVGEAPVFVGPEVGVAASDVAASGVVMGSRAVAGVSATGGS